MRYSAFFENEMKILFHKIPSSFSLYKVFVLLYPILCTHISFVALYPAFPIPRFLSLAVEIKAIYLIRYLTFNALFLFLCSFIRSPVPRTSLSVGHSVNQSKSERGTLLVCQLTHSPLTTVLSLPMPGDGRSAACQEMVGQLHARRW